MADIQTFITRLLSRPPGDPDSVQLQVDTGGDVAAFFEVLLTIMTGILKAWYPPPISISKLSVGDLEKIIRYFASFGIQFGFTEEPVPLVLRINNKEYETQHRLEDMKFQMTGGDKLYTVRFTFL
jgi:hypothetical protein